MKICEELSEHVFTFLEEPKIKKPLGNPLIPVPQQDALRLRSQGVNIESYRIIFSHLDSYKYSPKVASRAFSKTA